MLIYNPMRRPLFLLILFFLTTFIPVQKAFSYWIWTPKTGKWVNPKYAPRPTPQEQLEYALSFYKENKYKDAERELKSTLKYYPKSAEAAESQYYLGIVYEAQERYYEAYQAYQKVIDKYPFSERIQEIIEREFKLGEKFMSGEKRKFAGVNLPVENPAIEIFTKIVANSQYGPLAAIAQYKLGLVLMGLARYSEADDAFSKVISSYPTSEWAEAAKYQLAACQSKQSQGPEYDQMAMQGAKEKFEVFVKEHPEAALSKDAEKNIAELKNKEAEANYNIAVFYEKQKAWDSARTYYQTVMDTYPESQWAKPAEKKVKEIEERLLGKQKINKKALRQINREEKLAQKQEEIQLANAVKAEKKEQKAQAALDKKAEKQARKAALKEERLLKKEVAQKAKQAKIEAARAAKLQKIEAAKAAKAARLEQKRIAKEEKIRKAKEAKEKKLQQEIPATTLEDTTAN